MRRPAEAEGSIGCTAERSAGGIRSQGRAIRAPRLRRSPERRSLQVRIALAHNRLHAINGELALRPARAYRYPDGGHAGRRSATPCEASRRKCVRDHLSADGDHMTRDSGSASIEMGLSGPRNLHRPISRDLDPYRSGMASRRLRTASRRRQTTPDIGTASHAPNRDRRSIGRWADSAAGYMS